MALWAGDKDSPSAAGAGAVGVGRTTTDRAGDDCSPGRMSARMASRDSCGHRLLSSLLLFDISGWAASSACKLASWAVTRRITLSLRLLLAAVLLVGETSTQRFNRSEPNPSTGSTSSSPLPPLIKPLGGLAIHTLPRELSSTWWWWWCRRTCRAALRQRPNAIPHPPSPLRQTQHAWQPSSWARVSSMPENSR